MKRSNMRPVATWLGSAALLGVLASCSNPDPVVKFSSTDETVIDGTTLQWTFDDTPTGELPDDAVIFDGAWAVAAADVPESAPNELCQTATATFPAVELGQEVLGDLTMTARIRPLSGEEDQAAGLIFRVQDAENYYILRANALEKNVSFYKYTGGKRQFMKEDSADVQAGAWQTLSVVAVGETLQAYFNGELIVEVADSDFSAGHVGLWTKADSATCFDDVEVIAE